MGFLENIIRSTIDEFVEENCSPSVNVLVKNIENIYDEIKEDKNN